MNGSESCPTGNDVCGDTLWRPPKFDLRFLFLTTSLVAVWSSLALVLDALSLTMIATVMLTWLFGCPRTKKATWLVAAAIYIPFGWLILIDYPWNEYRWMWISMWGYVFGIVPIKMMPAAHLIEDPGTWLAPLALLFTAVSFFSSVSAIRFWPKTRWWIFVAVLALSCVCSFGCYQGFLM